MKKKINVDLISASVWQAADRWPRFSLDDMRLLVDESAHAPAKRARICLHPDQSDPMQEMLIAFNGTTYVRPSYHQGKDESFHVMDGFAKYIFFDDTGKDICNIRLGSYESDLPFYCRIPGGLSHSVVVLSEYMTAHEIGVGPFEKADTVFPVWSPDYLEADDQSAFRQAYAFCPVTPLCRVGYEQIDNEIYRLKADSFSVSKFDIDRLKPEFSKANEHPTRLYIQKEGALLLEEFVIYTSKSSIGVKLHVDTDRSLHILEGEVDVVFFDNAGNTLDVVELGEKTKGKFFCLRVPKGTLYSMVVKSDFLVSHEAMSGGVANNPVVVSGCSVP